MISDNGADLFQQKEERRGDGAAGVSDHDPIDYDKQAKALQKKLGHDTGSAVRSHGAGDAGALGGQPDDNGDPDLGGGSDDADLNDAIIVKFDPQREVTTLHIPAGFSKARVVDILANKYRQSTIPFVKRETMRLLTEFLGQSTEIVKRELNSAGEPKNDNFFEGLVADARNAALSADRKMKDDGGAVIAPIGVATVNTWNQADDKSSLEKKELEMEDD